MHSLVDFLKRAVGEGGTAGCYICRGGLIYAQNGALQAGAPFDAPFELNLPAGELEAALGRMGGEPLLNARDGLLVLRQGRLRSTLRGVLGEPTPPAELGGPGWLPVPAALPWALAAAAPFVGEAGWSQGVRLGEGRVTAINNRCGVTIDVEGLALEAPVLLPREAAEFIGSTAPQEYRADAGALLFRWPDGRWLRAQLLAYAMPPQVDGLFEKVGTAAPVPITDAWREAYADAAALAAERVTLRHDRLVVEGANSVTEIACASEGLPPEHRSVWSTKVLSSVAPLAMSWNPGAWPENAAFVGVGLRGLCVGVKA